MTQEERYQLARRLNTHWQYCPRCSKKSINKAMRICTKCKGTVLFAGDDGSFADESLSHWYMWYKSIDGTVGWFDKSYFANIKKW